MSQSVCNLQHKVKVKLNKRWGEIAGREGPWLDMGMHSNLIRRKYTSCGLDIARNDAQKVWIYVKRTDLIITYIT